MPAGVRYTLNLARPGGTDRALSPKKSLSLRDGSSR